MVVGCVWRMPGKSKDNSKSRSRFPAGHCMQQQRVCGRAISGVRSGGGAPVGRGVCVPDAREEQRQRQKKKQIPFGALHAAAARLRTRHKRRAGWWWRSRWSRAWVLADAREEQRQRQKKKQIPFGNDKQRGQWFGLGRGGLVRWFCAVVWDGGLGWNDVAVGLWLRGGVDFWWGRWKHP